MKRHTPTRPYQTLLRKRPNPSNEASALPPSFKDLDQLMNPNAHRNRNVFSPARLHKSETMDDESFLSFQMGSGIPSKSQRPTSTVRKFNQPPRAAKISPPKNWLAESFGFRSKREEWTAQPRFRKVGGRSGFRPVCPQLGPRDLNLLNAHGTKRWRQDSNGFYSGKSSRMEFSRVERVSPKLTRPDIRWDRRPIHDRPSFKYENYIMLGSRYEVYPRHHEGRVPHADLSKIMPIRSEKRIKVQHPDDWRTKSEQNSGERTRQLSLKSSLFQMQNANYQLPPGGQVGYTTHFDFGSTHLGRIRTWEGRSLMPAGPQVDPSHHYNLLVPRGMDTLGNGTHPDCLIPRVNKISYQTHPEPVPVPVLPKTVTNLGKTPDALKKVMKALSKIIYNRLLRRDKFTLRLDIERSLDLVNIELTHLVNLKNLLSRFMKGEVLNQRDLGLSNLEIVLFCLFLVKKRYLDLETLQWNVESLTKLQSREMLKRSEQNYKVILKRAFRTLIASFNAEHAVIDGSDTLFYSHFFGAVSKAHDIELENFKPQKIFNEIRAPAKTRRFQKRKSKKEFASLLKRSPAFMSRLMGYLRDDLKVSGHTEGILQDCMKELDRKLPLMIFNWQKRLGSGPDFKEDLISFLTKTLVNDKVKLPWSTFEVQNGVKSVIRLFQKS